MMLTAADIHDLLRHHKTMSMQTDAEMAAEFGVCQSYMSKLLAGDTKPGEKILSRLGLRKVVAYEPIRETDSRAS